VKGLILYLAALGGGAAVGAVGVGSFNVFLGDGAVVEEAAHDEEAVDANAGTEGEATGSAPREVAMAESGGAEAGDGSGASEVADDPDVVPGAEGGLSEVEGGESGANPGGLESDRAGSEVVEATQQAPGDVAAEPIPIPVIDADSLARITQNYQRLAQIFAAMKPEEAAPVLAQLDDAQLEGVLLAMQGRNAAPILAEMDPERAAAISRRVLGGNE